MTWGLAKFAALLGLTGSARRVEFRSVRKAGKHGPAQITELKLRPNGESILTLQRLKARALVQNNRNPEAVERYVQRHQILIKGACFDTTH